MTTSVGRAPRELIDLAPDAVERARDRFAVADYHAAVLLLELVQTRIFSVMLWHHLTYLVVTFTLLGFAAGGTVLACRPRWLQGDVRPRLAWASTLFGVTVIVACALSNEAPPLAQLTV